MLCLCLQINLIVKLKMNLERIKEKYKQILEDPEPQSAPSDEEWELAYSKMNNKRRKHILTQSHCINRSSFSVNHSSNTPNQQNIIKVKEKLAQSISNLNKKDCQIEELKSENIKTKQQVKLLQDQIAQLKQQLIDGQQKMIQQKVAYNCIQKNMENIQKCIQSQKMDKELLQRQIDYYQLQIETIKSKIDQKDIKMQEMKKEMRYVQKYKNMASKLKQDVTRLRELLGQTEKYKLFATKIENKHYLGKGCKQHECWIGEDLVFEVQNFLKKQQVGVGNKQFIQNLIKFISKHEDQAKINTQKKLKKVYTSKQKDHERKINHSLNFMEVREEQLKKSHIGSSLLKSRRNTLHDSKRTESYIYDKLQKSLVTHSCNKTRDICIQILSSFRKGVLQLTENKQLKRKKLIKLVDWAIEGVLSLFPKQKSVLNGVNGQNRMMDTVSSGNFRLQTEQIKITL